MIWRIPRRGGEDTFLVLLLEFQSRSDRFMAVRAMTYAGLVWQQLIEERRLPPRQGARSLLNPIALTAL